MTGWMTPALSTCALLLVVAGCAGSSEPPATHPLPPANDLSAIPDLPDLFTFRDGSRVQSPADWTRRRAELLALFQQYEYGHLPPAPGNTRAVELISHNLHGATHTQYKVTCGPNNSVSFVLDLLVPKSDGPVPVILRGDWGWSKTSDDITKEVLARGYTLAEFNRLELAPDNARRDAGLYLAYPDGDFAALAAWAWGFHRCVDVLEQLPQIDKSKIAITGHSRGGKATLLAGATDERIALVNPNASGTGGGAPFRNPPPKSETLEIIVKKFPFWFSPNLQQFIDRRDRLPFDQHALKACVAPRALLDTEGLDDLWASPSGARITHDAAKRVYDFLNASDRVAIHYRPGRHAHNVEDWAALLDFADKVFRNKPTTRPLDMRPTS